MSSVDKRITKLLDGQTVLPTSASTFLKSILKFYESTGAVSERQADVLKSMEEKYTPEPSEKREKWLSQYDEEKRNIAKICAQYYASSPEGYFLNIAVKVLTEQDFIPTEKQYNAMCGNKYASKVLESKLSEPKYPVGSFVTIRSGRGSYELRSVCLNRPAMVLTSDHKPITSSAKGSKPYRILPVGSNKHYDVEERDLKLCKGVK